MIRVAFVLLANERDIIAPMLATALNRRAPGLDFIPETAPSNDEVTCIDFDGGQVMVMPVPAPVPKGEADDGFKFSVAAFSPSFKVPKHTAHQIVTLRLEEEKPALETQLLFTRVIAAVLETTGAVAVYWGDAGVTHPADFFLDVASGDEHLWTMLWTGVSAVRHGTKRLSMLSLGMDQFNVMDAMVNGPAGMGNDLLIFMMDMLRYCIERGETIPDGDTVGRTNEERLKVKYVRSPIDAKKQVWSVDFP